MLPPAIRQLHAHSIKRKTQSDSRLQITDYKNEIWGFGICRAPSLKRTPSRFQIRVCLAAQIPDSGVVDTDSWFRAFFRNLESVSTTLLRFQIPK